jgi:very-short-patch-repair endonuclease
MGVPVVSAENATVDLLRLLPVDDARSLMYRLAQKNGAGGLAAVIMDALPLLGNKHGTRQLASLLPELRSGAEAESERLLAELLLSAGIAGHQLNFPVRVGNRIYRIDAAFPHHRVAIEVDGYAYHSDRRQFQRDRERQNDLVAAGWRIIRVTWHDLTRQPDRVVRRITEMLGQ